MLFKVPKSLMLCVVLGKYQGKGKKIKENNFLMFGLQWKIQKKIKYN